MVYSVCDVKKEKITLEVLIQLQNFKIKKVTYMFEIHLTWFLFFSLSSQHFKDKKREKKIPQ